MRVLVKCVFTAMFLVLGVMSEVSAGIIMLNANRDFKEEAEKLARAYPQRMSGPIDSDASEAPVVTSVDARLRATILEQTANTSNMLPGMQAQSLINLGGSIRTISPEEMQTLNEEYQDLLATIHATAQLFGWNGMSLLAKTQNDALSTEQKVATASEAEHLNNMVETGDVAPINQDAIIDSHK